MASTKELKQKPASQTPTMTKADKYRQALDEGPMFDMVTYFGHKDIHAETTDVALMDRLLTSVTESSAFPDQKTADDYIKDAMYHSMGDIVDWADNAQFGERSAIDVKFDDETVGKGFVMDKKTRTIKEYTTDTVRLVLKQDKTNPYGFSVLTAFPCMDTPNIQPTGRDLTPIVRATPTYQEASPVKRAYLEYRGKPESQLLMAYSAGHDPSDDCITMYAPTNNPNITHRLRIKEQGVALQTIKQEDDTRSYIPSEFSALRDKLMPQHAGKPNVFMNHKDIRAAFNTAYPLHGTVIRSLRDTIRTEKALLSLTPETKSIDIPTPDMADTVKEDRIKKAERISDNIEQPATNSMGKVIQLVTVFLLIGCLAFGAFAQFGHTAAQPTNDNIISTEANPTEMSTEPAVEPTDAILDDISEFIEGQPDDIENQPVDITETIVPEQPFFSNEITFTCEYVTPDDMMPYALYTPSSAIDEQPTALIVWLHGSGECNITAEDFLTAGLPAVLKNWDLDGFNAYILCPHLTGEYNGKWNTESSRENLQTLLDNIIANYNIDINNIIISGHSLGGSGAAYMAHELPEYFSKCVILSGYSTGVDISEIKMPVIAYIGTEACGEDISSIKYTWQYLATNFGDNNIITMNSSHGGLPYAAFTQDSDGDKQSDLIKWMFAELAADIADNITPSASGVQVDAVPLFFQTDYPDIPYSKGTVATSGCGISCLSMVASYLTNETYTPDILAKYNDSSDNNGSRMENAAIALGLNFTKSWYWSDVIKALQNNQIVIALVGSGTNFTSGGHFIVLTGITSDGKIMVNDPYEPNYKRLGYDKYIEGFDQSEITCDFNGAWIFEKKTT